MSMCICPHCGKYFDSDDEIEIDNDGNCVCDSCYDSWEIKK